MNLFTQLWKEPKIYSVLQLFDSLIKLHIVWYQVQYLASTASSVHPDSESSEEQQQSFVTLGLEKIWILACPLNNHSQFCCLGQVLLGKREWKVILAGRKINLSCTCPGQPDDTFFQTCSFNLVNGYFQETNVHGSSLYLI